jgi:hypothetical protein
MNDVVNRRHGPTRAQTGAAPRGGHHASTLHGQHSMGHAARRRGCRCRACGHAQDCARRSSAIVLRRHRHRVRRQVAPRRRGRLPHRQRVGRQQRGWRRSQPADRTRDHPAARADGGRQHQRAGADRRRLRFREQPGPGWRRRDRRPLDRRRGQGNCRPLDGLRRPHHAQPLPRQRPGRPRHDARTGVDAQQRHGAAFHQQRGATAFQQQHTSPSTGAWQVA